jgi:hypothetical protein
MESYEVGYPDGFRARLRFYRVMRFEGEPRNLDFAQIAWDQPERLPNYDFLEGDAIFVAQVARQERTPSR